MSDQPTTAAHPVPAEHAYTRDEPRLVVTASAQLLLIVDRAERGRMLSEEAQLLRAGIQRLASAHAEVLNVVSAWCIEANTYGGLDAGNLARRLAHAGHPLPNAEAAT